MKESKILSSPSQTEVNPSVYLHQYVLACLIIRTGFVEETKGDLETLINLIDAGTITVSDDHLPALKTYIKELKDIIRLVGPHIPS